MQNFAVGEFSVLQDGHFRPNGDAHSSQNLALSGFSALHFEQRIALAPPVRALPDLRMLHHVCAM
jgi:hypothetical protein